MTKNVACQPQHVLCKPEYHRPGQKVKHRSVALCSSLSTCDRHDSPLTRCKRQGQHAACTQHLPSHLLAATSAVGCVDTRHAGCRAGVQHLCNQDICPDSQRTHQPQQAGNNKNTHQSTSQAMCRTATHNSMSAGMSPSSGGTVSIWFSYSDSRASLVRLHSVDGTVRSWFLNSDLQAGGQAER